MATEDAPIAPTGSNKRDPLEFVLIIGVVLFLLFVFATLIYGSTLAIENANKAIQAAPK